jgi:hypothetical protein
MELRKIVLREDKKIEGRLVKAGTEIYIPFKEYAPQKKVDGIIPEVYEYAVAEFERIKDDIGYGKTYNYVSDARQDIEGVVLRVFKGIYELEDIFWSISEAVSDWGNYKVRKFESTRSRKRSLKEDTQLLNKFYAEIEKYLKNNPNEYNIITSRPVNNMPHISYARYYKTRDGVKSLDYAKDFQVYVAGYDYITLLDVKRDEYIIRVPISDLETNYDGTVKLFINEIRLQKAESTKKKPMREQSLTHLIPKLQKAFPYGKFKPSEDWDGSEGNIWASGEDSWMDKERYIPMFDYYTQDYDNYEFGVHNDVVEFLNKYDAFAEWYDSGTIMIYPI